MIATLLAALVAGGVDPRAGRVRDLWRHLGLTGDVRQTAAFRRWFGASRMVDDHGRPLLLYHGTAETFDAFELSRAGSVKYSDWGPGIYLTPRPGNADYYRVEAVKARSREYNDAFARWEDLARGAPSVNGAPQYSDEAVAALREFQRVGRHLDDTQAGAVLQLYARLERPYVQPYTSTANPALTRVAASMGCDGIVVLTPDGELDEVVVFSPGQVKSADNVGTFDPFDARIRYGVQP